MKRFAIGEAIQSLPGQTWNRFVDTTEKLERLKEQLSVGRAVESTRVDVLNSTSTDLSVGGIMVITGYEVNEDDELMLEGTPPDTDNYNNMLAITAEAIPEDQIGECVLHGLAKAYVNITSTQLRHVDITDDNMTTLTSHPAGRAQLAVAAASTGTQDVWVLLGSQGPLEWSGTSAAISAGSSGTVTLNATGSPTVTAHLDWMDGGEGISSGKEVLVRWFLQESKWRIVAAECE